MKLKKQIGFIFSCLLFLFYGCNTKSGMAEEKIPQKDSLIAIRKDSAAPDLEGKIMNLVMKLPEVEDVNHHIDSVTNHQKGVAGIIDEPQEGETDYGVRVGYNGDERFEVYYFFYVNPKTFQIKILDITTDSVMPVEVWRKVKSTEK